jgi:hypothetical protein
VVEDEGSGEDGGIVEVTGTVAVVAEPVVAITVVGVAAVPLELAVDPSCLLANSIKLWATSAFD